MQFPQFRSTDKLGYNHYLLKTRPQRNGDHNVIFKVFFSSGFRFDCLFRSIHESKEINLRKNKTITIKPNCLQYYF